MFVPEPHTGELSDRNRREAAKGGAAWGYDDGFTLLEVVVALAILAVSVTVTIQLVAGCFTNISRINQYFLAGNYAQNIMNELLVNPIVEPGFSMNGSFEDGFQWFATCAEKVMPPDPQWQAQSAVGQDQGQLFSLILLNLQVEIRWRYRGKEHQFFIQSAKIVNPRKGLIGSEVSDNDMPSGQSKDGSLVFGPSRSWVGRGSGSYR
jgi:type II secretion system protein I